MSVTGDASGLRAVRLPRVEDWLLAAWVAVVAPLLTAAQGTTGDVLPADRPLDGILGLMAIAGAALCLALRRPAAEGTDRAFLASAAVGPFVGGLLLVAAATLTALDLPSGAAMVLAGGLVVAVVVVRLRVPPAPAIVRRLLMTPFILVTGTLFWRLIHAVTAGGIVDQLRAASPADLRAGAPLIGFLVAFSAVYYAMLVAAPRQVADREGGLLAWTVRYLLFAAGVAFGIAWLPLLAG